MTRVGAALGLVLLALASTAVAQDTKPKPAKTDPPVKAKPPAAPPKAAPPAGKTRPAALKKPTPDLLFLGEDTIRRPDGVLVVFYRANYVDPAMLLKELENWAPNAKFEVAGPGTAAAPTSKTMQGKYAPYLKVSNVLRIELPETDWPDVKKVLELIDSPEPQVLVECKIIEVRHGEDLRFGLHAKVERPVGDTFFRKLESTFPTDFANGSTLLDLGTADKFLTFDYVLEMAQAGAHTEVLATPTVLASQGEVAEILVVDREPIVEQQLRSNAVTATTKFEDVGLTLQVQPLFVGRDFVRARVTAILSRVSEFRTTGTSSDVTVTNPVIATRSADTVLTVPNRETLVIGGLTSSVKTDEKAGLPWLRDLPVFGPLFGSTVKSEQKIELMFFITLSIMRPGDPEVRLVTPPSLRAAGGEGDASDTDD